MYLYSMGFGRTPVDRPTGQNEPGQTFQFIPMMDKYVMLI